VFRRKSCLPASGYVTLPAAPAPSLAWVTLDMSSWTLTAGTVPALVTAVTDTTISVADLAADTYAKMSRLGGDNTAPEVAAGKSLTVWIERTNAGATDRCGFLFGLSAGGSANAGAGCSETTGTSERLGLTNSTLTASTRANADAVRFSVDVDSNGKVTRWVATYYDMATGSPVEVATASGSVDTDPGASIYLACWVRHGGSTGGGAGSIEYAGKYLITDLEPT
jgi:hypothetical protein